MIQTSDAYKEMMNKPMRNQGYISVSLGVVNQNAQGNARLDNSTVKKYYSKGGLFDESKNATTYGTLEQDFTKADGSFSFAPRNTSAMVLQDNGLVVPSGNSLIIRFDSAYSIKGLTIDFVETSYPTDFSIVTDEENISISNNDTYNFTTDDVLGSTTSITITPTAMSGGEQNMHVKRIVMGVGLTFSNAIVESAELDSFISGISIETSYKELAVSAFDNYSQFDVDNENAFINYLQSGQAVNISFGVDLDDNTQEWFQVASCRLKDWSAKKGRISFHATDLLSRTDETYSHMVLTSRTAKSEFEAIFSAMGLTANDYHIDDYFASVNITNPIEENTFRDCLQLIANATRGVVYEDEYGIVHVEKNFDRFVNLEETRYVIARFSYEHDQYGNPYMKSVNKTLDDGTFRSISTKNLFNPSESEGNTVTIALHQTGMYEILPFSVVDNFIVQGENANNSQRADVTVTVKCPRDSKYFPIKESGWYCAGISDGVTTKGYDSSYVSYAKLGSRNLQIESTNQKFNFYVSESDLNAGDLEIQFTMWETYTATASRKIKGVGIRKGKLNSQGYMEGYEENEKLYEPYFTNQYPYMLYEWDGGTNTSGVGLLYRFVKPKPTKVRTLIYDTSNQQTVRDYDITSDFLECEIPRLTTKFYMQLLEAEPNSLAILYRPKVISLGGYGLSSNAMMEQPYATMDEKVKAIRVKIFTYQNNGGEIEQVNDEVYYTETLDTSGIVKTIENPLINTSAQAELVAKWAKAYYTKNLTYNFEYRGEPALQSNDLVYAESDVAIVNVLDAEKTKLTFNGAFRGQIEARKTLAVES